MNAGRNSKSIDALPSGWRSRRADDVGEVRLGRQRSPKNRSAQFPTSYLRAANITESGLDLSDVLEMDFNPAERERYRLQDGDLVLSEASGSASQVGRPALWRDELSLCCFQNTVIRLRPRDCDPRYLLWLFTHFWRNGVFATVAGGVGINHLGAAKFAQLQLPIAPRDQQRRIVVEIEKQFTRLDAGVAALRLAQAKLKRYRAAVLKAACEGLLVPTEAALARKEGRTYETGEQLLARILEERRDRSIGKRQYKEPAAPDLASCAPLPEAWAAATVEQVTIANRPSAYGVLQPGAHVQRGVPLVRVGDINDGRVDVENLKRISPTIADQYPRTKLRGGELAITLVGAIGRTAVIPSSLAGANTARAVGIVPLTQLMNAHWVEIWFRSPRTLAHMISKSHEVARKTLNLEDVRAATIAIPPAAEQERIVAEVERRLSVVAALEQSVTANLERADRLRQSILDRAFTGRLVNALD